MNWPLNRSRTLSLLVLVALSAAVCATTGCSTLGYYAHSVSGHLALVGSARPVDAVLADPQTDAQLKARLVLAQQIRDFAVAELAEPDNASYRRYADLKRSAAVWNVVAAPPLSLTLKTWCFLVVGCVSYRGYYDRAAADAFAAELSHDGDEVNVYPVTAYSTLGVLPFDFFADPLLNTFIDYPEAELARLIFHELAHQIAYAPGDTVFNESFATAVERLGSERWLATHASQAIRDASARADQRRQEFRALTSKYRDALDTLYQSGKPDAAKQIEKARLYAAMRSEYATLKASRWDGYNGYDRWVAEANNAAFGVLAAYTELVPSFIRLFEREAGDFNRFYAEAKRLAGLEKSARRAALAR